MARRSKKEIEMVRKLKLFYVLGLLMSSSHVFADGTSHAVKHLSAWISDLRYDATNDCYVARYRPTAKMCARVYMGSGVDAQKVQPGECYVLKRGEGAMITQHAHAWCSLTYTNGVHELDGVPLMDEFKDSERQLLVQGRYATDLDAFKKYAFVVNAEGYAYEVSTYTKFHFGFPFHAPEDKSPPSLSRGMENIQRKYREEGLEAYKTVLDEPLVQAMKDSVMGGMTNAVSFVRDMGGMGNLSEKDKTYLIQLDPENARLFAKLDATRWKDTYVGFCTIEKKSMRILAVARITENDWRFWTYVRDGVPEFVFLGDGQGTSDNYYEYGEDGLFRNFCLASKSGVNYHTIKDGVLQKSLDIQKAKEFVSKVEGIFYRYVELDTTGTLKSFVEKLKSQAGAANAKEKAK